MRALFILMLIFFIGCSSKSSNSVGQKNDTVPILVKYIASDSTLLNEIDSMFNVCFTREDFEILVSLNELCSTSDGYVSEYFMVKMDQFFNQNIKFCIKSLYSIGGSCLEERLIDEWSINDVEENSLKLKMRKSRKLFSEQEMKFFNGMLVKIDSKKWD